MTEAIVTVDSGRKSEATLRRLHGDNAVLIDVTSRSAEPPEGVG
jgi:hypothetical protein